MIGKNQKKKKIEKNNSDVGKNCFFQCKSANGGFFSACFSLSFFGVLTHQSIFEDLILYFGCVFPKCQFQVITVCACARTMCCGCVGYLQLCSYKGL